MFYSQELFNIIIICVYVHHHKVILPETTEITAHLINITPNGETVKNETTGIGATVTLASKLSRIMMTLSPNNHIMMTGGMLDRAPEDVLPLHQGQKRLNHMLVSHIQMYSTGIPKPT